MKLNFQKLDIEIPVEIPVNFMISTGTGIPANRLILTGTGILPGSRSILAWHKKPRHNLIVVLHLKSCGAAEKSLRGCMRRAIIEVATPR